MSDYENNNENSNQSRPDYYQPNSSGTQPNNNGSYYTPPQDDKPPFENTTYHYSYNNNNNQQNNNNSNYYTPPQNDYSSNYNPMGNDNNNENKPPKKSKAAIIIVVVLVACLVVAGVALVVSATGLVGSSNSNSDSTTTTQSANDTQLSESEDVPLKDSDNNYTVAGVADVALDSCVGITVYTNQASSSYYYFYGYGQNDNSSSEPTKSGEGSGILMREENGKTYVITAAHVISDGDSFTVTLNDGTECDATVVGYDSQTDIGVLSIDKTGLKIADFADSTSVVVGEQCVVIGCPGGLEFMNSVTSGYVSALDRPVSSSIGYDKECIQTDAAINPGNSGGALLNMQGQVIGIVSSKIASTEYEGMGFAVPSKTAIETANSLIKVGYVEGRAKIGVTYAPITSYNNSSTIISALAEKGYKDAQGTMVISSVNEDSDLYNKDVKSYDMIVAINGETLTSTDVLTSTLSKLSPGDTVKLTIARIENNEIQISEIDCTLIESKG